MAVLSQGRLLPVLVFLCKLLQRLKFKFVPGISLCGGACIQYFMLSVLCVSEFSQDVTDTQMSQVAPLVLPELYKIYLGAEVRNGFKPINFPLSESPHIPSLAQFLSISHVSKIRVRFLEAALFFNRN